MNNDQLIFFTLIAAALQVLIQFLGLVKAWIEWRAARNEKGFNRRKRLKPRKKK